MTFLALLKRNVLAAVESRIAAALSAVGIALVLTLAGVLVLTMLFFALAHLIGQLCGSAWVGFAVLTAVAALCFALIWANRQRWIAAPITRMVNDALGNVEDTAPTTTLNRVELAAAAIGAFAALYQKLRK